MNCTELPDHSCCFVAEFELPAEHWLYQETPENPAPILGSEHRPAVRAAVQRALQAATACGKTSLDPDALVLNVQHALCGDLDPLQPVEDLALQEFAQVMKAKLAKCRAKGRSGWDDPAQCSVQDLAAQLVQHVLKGDPVNVANFAMFLYARGASPAVLTQEFKKSKVGA